MCTFRHTHTFRDTQTDSKRCLTCIKTRPLSLYLVFILMYFYFRGNPAVFPRRVEVMWILKSYCFLNKWASSHKIFHVCTHTPFNKTWYDLLCMKKWMNLMKKTTGSYIRKKAACFLHQENRACNCKASDFLYINVILHIRLLLELLEYL